MTRPLAPVLMIQGTSSHAGKSTLVAALCRWFANAGLNVAPFKAQNMSLNAAVTPDGSEIGRAQMLQAIAARVPATAAMNPILLKPHSEQSSQVVVMGRARDVRSARDYFALKDQLWPVVADALDTVRSEHDLVIAEGAGSPAEINLRDRDIVNMRVALHANAAVLIVGDIERGGVFAALAGTMQLIAPEERALVRGFIINKFRGDVTLVEPGPAMLQSITGVATLGVLPFLRDLQLPEEDALGVDAPDVSPADAAVDIAIIRLPHLANFDDFDPLRHRRGVSVRYIADAASLGTPDLVILPGSKTTMPDLAWLERVGLGRAIREHRARGGAVLGVCGGYQMLGEELADPDAIESTELVAAGLGLLPHRTTFTHEKRTVQVYGNVLIADGPFAATKDCAIEGYEIHMGISTGSVRGAFRLQRMHDEAAPVDDGGSDTEGLVVGTYLHGLFHNRDFTEQLLQSLAARRGTTLPPRGDERTIDSELDRLAAFVAQHLDMHAIADMVGVAVASAS